MWADRQEVPVHADARLPWMRAGARPRLQRRAQHLDESLGTVPWGTGKQPAPLRRGRERLGRGGRYCLVRENTAASHLAEPGTPRFLCGGSVRKMN